MLYNAQRQRVRDWQQGQISTCPDCQRGLFARRGEKVIWHWSHYPNGDITRPAHCGNSETPWHLAWKQAYDQMAGWEVERQVGRYRADAVNLRTRNVREFIHSISAFYDAKHRSYASLHFNVVWIFDGDHFVGARRRSRRNGGYAQLLKPRAYDLHVALKRQCWIHWDGDLWKEWKDNVWYPRSDKSAPVMLDAFKVACLHLGISSPQRGTLRSQEDEFFGPPDIDREALRSAFDYSLICEVCKDAVFAGDLLYGCSQCGRGVCTYCCSDADGDMCVECQRNLIAEGSVPA